MAGEWIAIDLALPDKPEFQELMDLTGKPWFEVQGWLIKMWGWASMHCADGTARMTVPRMVRTWGADEAFWRAVAAVGWLELDETAATVAVPGWDRRFSQAAKARLQHRDRAASQNEREPDRRKRSEVACAQAQATPALPRSRGNEMKEEVPPPPREAAPVWEQIREAWNTGAGKDARRKPWKPATPPIGGEAVLGDPEWAKSALEAIQRLPQCSYFSTPATMIQLFRPGFVEKVLGGVYDEPKAAPKPSPALDGRPSAAEAAEAWKRGAADPDRARAEAEYLEAKRRRASGAADDPELEAARRAMVNQLRGGAA